MVKATDVEDFVSDLEKAQDKKEEELAGYRSVAEFEKVRRRALGLARDLKASLVERDRLEAALSLIQTVEGEHTKPPSWAAPKASKRAHKAIPTLLLSDLHL